MKKNQPKSHFKEMKGNGKEVASSVVRIREPEHEVKLPNCHATIEAAFASLKRDYGKG